MKITPADRISKVEEYYFSVKLKQIEQMRQEGKDVINLGIGSPDLMPDNEVIKTLQISAENPNHHGYQSYVGIPQLREAFSSFYKNSYGVDVNPANEVLPLIGSKEGIMHISMAFVNPGDEVLVPNPGYPTYSSVSKLVQAEMVEYDLTEENGWLPDLKELEKRDLSKVKLMWVNYPNMPTGTASNRQLMEELVAFGKKHSIIIVNDNPYSFILNSSPSSILEVKGAKDIVIELNSLSKSHNMAGWRMGMVISNPEFINYILRVKSNMDSGMFKPMQEAAVKALSLESDWFEKVNSEYRARREVVFELLDLLNCSYDRNQVGLFVWAKIPSKYERGVELSDIILEKANVFITPGFIFGSNGEKYIRISLCAKEDVYRESINRIKNIENL